MIIASQAFYAFFKILGIITCVGEYIISYTSSFTLYGASIVKFRITARETKQLKIPVT